MFGVADSASHDHSTICFNVGVLKPDELDSSPQEFVESCRLSEENFRGPNITPASQGFRSTHRWAFPASASLEKQTFCSLTIFLWPKNKWSR